MRNWQVGDIIRVGVEVFEIHDFAEWGTPVHYIDEYKTVYFYNKDEIKLVCAKEDRKDLEKTE